MRQYGLDAGYAVFVVDGGRRVVWRQFGSDGASSASPSSELGRREFLASLLGCGTRDHVRGPGRPRRDQRAAEPTAAPSDRMTVSFPVPEGHRGGTTGVAAAVANAVYHATGIRVRDLPITLDRLLKEGLHA